MQKHAKAAPALTAPLNSGGVSKNKEKFVFKKVLGMAAIALLPSISFAGASCVGEVSRLWVEKDDVLNFNIQPTNVCDCNFNVNGSKGFKVPANQLNREEQYSALLAAFMANKKVESWFDWDGADGINRCNSWSISFSK